AMASRIKASHMGGSGSASGSSTMPAAPSPCGASMPAGGSDGAGGGSSTMPAAPLPCLASSALSDLFLSLAAFWRGVTAGHGSSAVSTVAPCPCRLVRSCAGAGGEEAPAACLLLLPDNCAPGRCPWPLCRAAQRAVVVLLGAG